MRERRRRWHRSSRSAERSCRWRQKREARGERRGERRSPPMGGPIAPNGPFASQWEDAKIGGGCVRGTEAGCRRASGGPCTSSCRGSMRRTAWWRAVHKPAPVCDERSTPPTVFVARASGGFSLPLHRLAAHTAVRPELCRSASVISPTALSASALSPVGAHRFSGSGYLCGAA